MTDKNTTKIKEFLRTSNGKAIAVIALIIIIALVMSWFNKADAGGYHHVNNYTTNNYTSNYSSKAMGACALGTAQAQINPDVHSNDHQWGIGVGHCEGGSEENALAVGYASRVDTGANHKSMFNLSIGRSSDEVTAFGAGINFHF